MSKRKILYFDMDGVLVDFVSGINRLPEETVLEYQDHLDDVPGIFALMDPVPGAIEAVKFLAKQYDVYILSTAPWNNPSAWADKVRFVQKYFPEVFHKRLILSHHKELCRGDYLIDDRSKHGAKDFKGEWIQFRSKCFPDWDAVVDYLDTGKDLDKEDYDKEVDKVVKVLIERMNAHFPDPRLDGYPVSWRPIDRIAYEYDCLGYSLDDIEPNLEDRIHRMLEKCTDGTNVYNLNDPFERFIEYLHERTSLKKISQYYMTHG